jgi:hypothetical protein
MAADRVMLLIDADNVSLDVVEQALPWVHKHFGGPHVRRAYCTAEAAVKNQDAFKKLSIRPMVNLAAGKNSTDIALAVDAVDLACAERPAVMVIVSSDADFSPLVLKLREKGCRVQGIGQSGKVGDDTRGVYDEFIEFDHRKPGAPATAAKKAARAPRTAPARKIVKAVPAPKPVEPAWPDDVAAILQAVSALQSGAKVELGIAAERLRAAGLLAKSAPSTKLFKKHPRHFELTPEKQPNKVQFLGAAG